MEHPSVALKDWLRAIAGFGKKWNHLLSSLCHQRDLALATSSLGMPQTSIVSIHACQHCSSSFDTLAALRTHMFRHHGYRNPARYYISHDNTCAACLMSWTSRDDVFKHLAYGPNKCLTLLQQVWDPIDHELAIALDAAAVEQRISVSKARTPRTPPVRLQGPRVSPCLAAVRGHKKHFSQSACVN